MNKPVTLVTSACNVCNNKLTCTKLRRFRHLSEQLEEVCNNSINIDAEVKLTCNNFSGNMIRVPEVSYKGVDYDEDNGTINFV